MSFKNNSHQSSTCLFIYEQLYFEIVLLTRDERKTIIIVVSIELFSTYKILHQIHNCTCIVFVIHMYTYYLKC